MRLKINNTTSERHSGTCVRNIQTIKGDRQLTQTTIKPYSHTRQIFEENNVNICTTIFLLKVGFIAQNIL